MAKKLYDWNRDGTMPKEVWGGVGGSTCVACDMGLANSCSSLAGSACCRRDRNLAAATALIGVATADLFPRVTVAGNFSLQAVSFTNIGTSGSDAYFLSPRIFWAAFDLGRVRARIQAADARADAALAQYELTVLTALEETENALGAGEHAAALPDAHVALRAVDDVAREAGVSQSTVSPAPVTSAS